MNWLVYKKKSSVLFDKKIICGLQIGEQMQNLILQTQLAEQITF